METALRNTRPAARQMYLDPRTKILLCLTVSSITFAGSNVGIMRYVLPCLAVVPLISFVILKKPLLSVYYVVMYFISMTVPPSADAVRSAGGQSFLYRNCCNIHQDTAGHVHVQFFNIDHHGK